MSEFSVFPYSGYFSCSSQLYSVYNVVQWDDHIREYKANWHMNSSLNNGHFLF